MGGDEARHVPIRVVTAFRYDLTDARLRAFVTVPSVDVLEPRQVAEQLVAKAMATVAAGAEAVGAAVDGAPLHVLVSESAHASVLVLGLRQLKAVGSAALGSVSAAVAARSAAPTVVVRGPPADPSRAPLWWSVSTAPKRRRRCSGTRSSTPAGMGYACAPCCVGTQNCSR